LVEHGYCCVELLGSVGEGGPVFSGGGAENLCGDDLVVELVVDRGRELCACGVEQGDDFVAVVQCGPVDCGGFFGGAAGEDFGCGECVECPVGGVLFGEGVAECVMVGVECCVGDGVSAGAGGHA